MTPKRVFLTLPVVFPSDFNPTGLRHFSIVVSPPCSLSSSYAFVYEIYFGKPLLMLLSYVYFLSIASSFGIWPL